MGVKWPFWIIFGLLVLWQLLQTVVIFQIMASSLCRLSSRSSSRPKPRYPLMVKDDICAAYFLSIFCLLSALGILCQKSPECKTTRRFLLCLGSQKKKQPPVFVVIFDPWTWPTICPKGPAHWWSACCSMAFTMEYHHLNDIRIYGPCFLRESAVATWMSQSGWFVCLLPIRCFEMTCSKILPSGCGVDCSLRPMCSKSSGPCKRQLQSHI